ncbi:MAG: hypothetical protein RL607_34 [Bacteroidota bacterium]|jgi:hypothetical protein
MCRFLFQINECNFFEQFYSKFVSNKKSDENKNLVRKY